MPNFSTNFRKIIFSVWATYFEKNDTWHGSQVTNDHISSPSSYLRGFRMIDITSVSGAILIKPIPRVFLFKKLFYHMTCNYWRLENYLCNIKISNLYIITSILWNKLLELNALKPWKLAGFNNKPPISWTENYWKISLENKPVMTMQVWKYFRLPKSLTYSMHVWILCWKKKPHYKHFLRIEIICFD